MSEKSIYKIIFYNEAEVFEVYARDIYQSEMYGFVEVEEFIFGERTQVIVDPAEEKLKAAFSGVKRSYIPMQSIIRIDQVEKEGQVKVSDIKSNDKVANFPSRNSFSPKPRKD